MKNSGKCPKCSGTIIIPKTSILDRAYLSPDQRMRLMVYKDPDASFDKEPVFSTVSAWICAECGFIELHADRPEVLKEAHLNAVALEEKRKSTV